MTLARLLAFVPMLLTAAMALTLPLASNITDASIDKRWYSVAPQNDPSFKGVGPWPPVGTPDQHGDRLRPVNYCFSDAEVAQGLEDIVKDAAALWQSASYPSSTLRIQLHPHCHGDATKTCNMLPQPLNGLVISKLGPKDSPSTTIGYAYDSFRKSHTLKFGGYGDPKDGSALPRASQVVSMAHELGHAIGLEHEHQRPSLHQQPEQILFRFDNLADYAEAEQNVKGVNNVFDKDSGSEAESDDSYGKMEQVCSSKGVLEGWTKEFCAIAASFVPLDHDTVTIGGEASYLCEGGPFDAESIMNYASFAHAGDPLSRNLQDAVLVGLRYVNGQRVEYEIFQGGPNHRPSAGDIARVKVLYPVGRS